MVALWLLPLRRSLWVDEAGTYWTIKDGLQETVHRALRYQGQSPLYYFLTWLTLAAGERSEWTLRLPSILAAGGAAFLLYRLEVLLFDRQTGLMAVIAFVGLRRVVFAATNARPYALGLLLVRRRSWEEAFAARSAELALGVTWSVTATMVLIMVSWLTPAKLFGPPHYVLATAPGTALMIAWAIRTMRSARARMVIITGVAAWLAMSPQFSETSGGWRAAAAAARSARGDSETPVLVHSGLIESRQIEWLDDKEKSSNLLSPVAFYPIGGAAVPLPWSVEGDAATYLEGIAKTRLEQHGQFVLVAATATKFRTWFDRRMQAVGFTARDVGTFERLSVVVFDRRSD
jgi:hypothetical protein